MLTTTANLHAGLTLALKGVKPKPKCKVPGARMLQGLQNLILGRVQIHAGKWQQNYSASETVYYVSAGLWA